MGDDKLRREAEDIAVPKADVAEEAVEGIGEAGADSMPDDPGANASPRPGAAHPAEPIPQLIPQG
jgi:hypothetical protein